MKILYAFLFFNILSCQIKNDNTTNPESPKENQEKSKVDYTERLMSIEPDLFIVEESLSNQFMSGKNLDFFQSEEDNAKLFFVPYTDRRITTAILTRTDLPAYYKELLISENLNIEKPELKPVFMKKILSKKGISINSKKADVLSVFGNPKEVVKENNLDVWKWKFSMKESESDSTKDLQPFILDSLNLEFDINIYFKDDLIEMLVYEYQVP